MAHSLAARWVELTAHPMVEPKGRCWVLLMAGLSVLKWAAYWAAMWVHQLVEWMARQWADSTVPLLVGLKAGLKAGLMVVKTVDL